MLLISLAILFAGIGMASLGDPDEDAATTASSSEAADAATESGSGASMLGSGAPSAAPNTAQTPPAATPGAAAASPARSSTSAAAPATPAPVRVLNNSNVAGLAAQTASLLEDEGFTIEDTGNYSNGTVGMTTVYYGTTPGEEETALEVADALGVSAQPRLPGLADEAPGVIVIVAAS